jgi:uncharacterized membrane-anchored protein YhcB (DUF1043 family)
MASHILNWSPETTFLTFLAIIIALILGFIVFRMLEPKRCRKEIARIQREIEDAERHHAPRAHLHRQIVQLRCRELRS